MNVIPGALSFGCLLVVLSGGPAIEMDTKAQVCIESVEGIAAYEELGKTVQHALKVAKAIKLGKVAADPLVVQEVNALAKRLKRVFQDTWGDLSGTKCVTEEGRDILVAQWEGKAGEEFPGPILLWDEPEITLIIMKSKGKMPQGTESFAKFLRDAIVITDSPLRIYELVFLMPKDWKKKVCKGMGDVRFHNLPASTTFSQYFQFSVVAYSIDEELYFVFSLGKALTGSLEEEGSQGGICDDVGFLPERFPPLSKRLGNRKTAELISDLGKGGMRDSILLKETAKRGVTVKEWDEIVTNKEISDEMMSRRVQRVLRATISAGKINDYEPRLRRTLEIYEKAGAKRIQTLRSFVERLAQARDLDFTPDVIKLMENKEFQEAGLRYLMFWGRTKEMAEKVSKLKVEPEQQDLKEFAVKEIIRSMESELRRIEDEAKEAKKKKPKG
jgi:hypothetical protein